MKELLSWIWRRPSAGPAKAPVSGRAAEILKILDEASERVSFPVLDNGYIYPAACRLSLFRSSADWAMVFELFGFSPRVGLPDIQILTFAGTLHNRKSRDSFVSSEAYENYLRNNPHE